MSRKCHPTLRLCGKFPCLLFTLLQLFKHLHSAICTLCYTMMSPFLQSSWNWSGIGFCDEGKSIHANCSQEDNSEIPLTVSGHDWGTTSGSATIRILNFSICLQIQQAETESETSSGHPGRKSKLTGKLWGQTRNSVKSKWLLESSRDIQRLELVIR